ncbi:ribokinase [Erysipelothrix rhusiopathiae]|uniref:ribokinase n=1 Tax=Erysipelothrix rhusiopathiae TaxID=1648 RepID=UPI002B2468DA|nr:ribokinase [Erysipelothrix rhusiopathiae]WRB93558.1 ribokinase [Erysipelothrix rhusiopathiae]
MSSKIYVLGSINVDLMISANRMPQQGETIAGYDYFEAIGGKGGNQAAACANLGVSTFLIGSVGRDYHGQLALNALNNFGVNTNHVLLSDDEHTGVAMILKTDHDNRIIINQGANANISVPRIHESLQGSNQDFFLTQFEVPLYAVYEGLKQAKTLGMTTVVNPAPAVVMNEDFYPLIDYLVVNQSESEILTEIFPHDLEDCKRAATTLFERGVKTVVFTLGGSGSICISKDHVDIIPSYAVEVVDTTGAGDAYIGTFLYGLSKQWNLQKALTYASAAGALACTKQGAQEALPTLETLTDFMNQGGNHE